MVTPCKIVEQYYNQEIGIDQIQWFYLDCKSFTYPLGGGGRTHLYI